MMKLLEFPHSHYCEKARWALDYKRVPFEVVTVMPGLHMFTVRRVAPGTSVPVLINENEVVQGSGSILDYLEKEYPEPSLMPENVSDRQACLEVEQAMDKPLGVNIRRILYYYLLSHPDFVRYCFTHSMPRVKQFMFRLFYPVLRKKIYQSYVISIDRVEQARREFDDAMTELEKLLGQRPYLIGEQFSRADLSVAAMLSLLVMPREHPFPWIEIPDPKAQTFFDEYRHHPVTKWVRTIYRDHRPRRSADSSAAM